MPKAKYYFNTHSLKYEKVVISWGKRILRVLGFLATAIVFSVVIVAFAYAYLDSPKESSHFSMKFYNSALMRSMWCLPICNTETIIFTV
jgi:hypothetical protein